MVCLFLLQTSSSQVFQAAVETAIAAGYRHLDAAYCYRNEKEVGAAIRAKIQQGVIKREDMFIVSKVRITFLYLGFYIFLDVFPVIQNNIDIYNTSWH